MNLDRFLTARYRNRSGPVRPVTGPVPTGFFNPGLDTRGARAGRRRWEAAPDPTAGGAFQRSNEGAATRSGAGVAPARGSADGWGCRARVAPVVDPDGDGDGARLRERGPRSRMGLADRIAADALFGWR